MSFELTADDLEASELYPDYKYVHFRWYSPRHLLG
jgi:hypothetical protein